MSTYRVAITVLFLVSFAFPKISILPVDSIRPGMKGIGRSVFSGTKVEEFEVEVLDVMRNVSPHRDIILCRLSGAGLEKTGVIAGMSGSPVYINNKLAGAVASTWSFAKEPVAGVTPAKEMLDIWDREMDSSTRQSLPRAHRKGFLHFSRNDGARGLGRKEKIKTGKGGLMDAECVMNHLPLPLIISGFNPAIKEIAQPILAQYNLTLVGATGSAPNTLDTANLIPGGAVGVGLIDGDVRLAAVGTITHREGNRILAFGHPLFLAGDVALPMTGGVIHSVLPSMELSFKIFSPSPPIGVITQDRESGVSGLIGPLPPMVPISVAVTLSGERRDIYNLRVAKHELLTPLLIAIGLLDIALQPIGTMEEITLNSQIKLFLQDSTPTTIHHTFAGPNPVVRFFEKTHSELKLLFENPFQPVELKKVAAEFTFSEGRKTAQLLSAQTDRVSLKPGETLSLRLRFREYRGEEIEKEVVIPIPVATPPGTLTISIASKDEFLNSEMNRAAQKLVPTSFSHLLKIIEESGQEEEIVVAGYIPAPGLVIEGKELPQPPPFLRQVLSSPKGRGSIQPIGQSLLFKIPVALEWLVSGSINLEIKVEN